MRFNEVSAHSKALQGILDTFAPPLRVPDVRAWCSSSMIGALERIDRVYKEDAEAVMDILSGRVPIVASSDR